MRLLIVVNVYDPDLGGGVLFADLAEGLARRGFEVEVRCAVPYYPEWADKTGKNGLGVSDAVIKGVRVRRHGLFIPSDPGSLPQRLVYEASFFASLMRNLPAPGSFDLVMTFCPLVGGVGFGAVAAAISGCPLWLNVQDLSAEAAAAAGIVRNAHAGSLIRRLQRFLFNRADVWSTISPVMADRLRPLTRRNQPVHELPNWLHGSLADAIASTPPADANRDRPWRLLYSGNIGGKQDLLRFCKMLAATRASFEFRIRGGGAEADGVRRWIADSGDGRFEFAPLSDEAGLASALTWADLFVVTEKAGAGGSFIPSKLLPAYGAGTPVWGVSDIDTPLGRELGEAGPGPAHTWDDLTAGFAFLLNHSPGSEVVQRWRQASRARATYFNRDRILDRYAALLREAAGSATTP